MTACHSDASPSLQPAVQLCLHCCSRHVVRGRRAPVPQKINQLWQAPVDAAQPAAQQKWPGKQRHACDAGRLVELADTFGRPLQALPQGQQARGSKGTSTGLMQMPLPRHHSWNPLHCCICGTSCAASTDAPAAVLPAPANRLDSQQPTPHLQCAGPISCLQDAAGKELGATAPARWV